MKGQYFRKQPSTVERNPISRNDEYSSSEESLHDPKMGLIRTVTPIRRSANIDQGKHAYSNSVLQSMGRGSLNKSPMIQENTLNTPRQLHPGQGVVTPAGNAGKRTCNCKRSNCLKLYCDCFASGEYCSNCNCICCFNNNKYDAQRKEAIRSVLDKNPGAFRPKISSASACPLSPTSKELEFPPVKHCKVLIFQRIYHRAALARGQAV